MNGRAAKKLRREAYGDLSLKAPRKYLRDTKTGRVILDQKSPRVAYQKLKREHMKGGEIS